jgi:UDPglucose 6-dehydrogenase
MLEYATVSKALADGMALLLQSVGIVPSLRARMMNKSTQPAYILRVSGYEQISALANAFGGKRREQIASLLAGYQRHIRQRGFARHGTYATLTVREVWSEPVETTVYSMETSTGTLIASSGLVSHNCFPKDVKALAHMADQAGLHPQLLDAVMKINKDQRHVVIDKLEAAFGGAANVPGKTIAVLGLAFKDNTDDMREAPSIDIIHWLTEAGAVVRAFDPVATETAQAVLPAEGITYCDDEYAAAEGADAIVVLTEWKRFREETDMERLRSVMRNPERGAVLIDGRNLYDPEEMTRLGYHYQGIGRGNGRRRTVMANGATPADE